MDGMGKWVDLNLESLFHEYYKENIESLSEIFSSIYIPDRLA